jgi:hypothetical protein
VKRFFRGTQGSVSVYLIVILVPVFLFQALLVDLIRIRSASRESEIALKSGLRSVMSRYDPALADYGLYGLPWDSDESLQVFHEVVDHNLSNSSSEFHYTDTTSIPDQAVLKPVYMLSNPAVFKRQVTEEMKVKAPVEFLTELADKFKKTGAAAAYAHGADYYSYAGKLEDLYWKREEALDQAWAAAQDLIVISLAGVQSARKDLNKLQELSNNIGLRSAEEIRQAVADTEQRIIQAGNQLDTLQDSIRQTEASLAGIPKTVIENAQRIQALQAEIVGLENDLGTVRRELENLYSLKDSLAQVVADMAKYTAIYLTSRETIGLKADSVRLALVSVEESLDEASLRDLEWKREWDKLSAEQASGQGFSPELYQMAGSYPSEFISIYRIGAGKISAAFNGLAARWSEVEWWQSVKWDGLLSDTDYLEEQIRVFEAERKAEEAKREQRNTGLKREEQKHRSTVKSALGEMKQALGACNLGEDPYEELYGRLNGSEGLTSKYRAYHRLPALEEDAPNIPDQAEVASSRGMDMLGKIGDMMAGFRDEWMVHEYLLDKFSYRTTGMVQPSGNPQLQSRSRPESHPLQNQEAEYALYGFGSCGANIGAAYGELFLIVFAIRTVEALMEPGTQAMQAGSPLLAFLAAAAKGAVSALEDSRKLSEGGSVALFKKLNGFQVSYKDFLRLFLMLHPYPNSVMARIQALVELNTNTDLTNTTTYVQGTSAASVKLWFIPGMLGWLERYTGIGYAVEDGRCLIRKTAVYAYD